MASNVTGINLLPVAVPHPTGPQHGQSERNGEEKVGKEEVRYRLRTRKGEIIKEETVERNVRLVTARTDTGRCEGKGKLCPLVCDNTPC